MKIYRQLIIALLLIVAGGARSYAQTAVTAGSQVTSESGLVSGKAYLLKMASLTGTPWITDNGTTAYPIANNNSSTLASVFYLIQDGSSWKVESAFTGKYWPTPTGNSQVLVPSAASNAGSWTLTFEDNVASFNNGSYYTNRSDSKLIAHTSNSKITIYEVNAPALATSSPYSDFAGKDIEIAESAAASLTENQWYVVKNQGTNNGDGGRGYIYENQGSQTFYNTGTVPSGDAVAAAKYLVRVLNAGDGKYYLQTGFGNYMGTIADGNGNSSATVPVTSLGAAKFTIAKINGTDGHFYIQNTTDNVVLNAVSLSSGDAKLVGWGTTAPTATNGNNDWAFYQVELVESWIPTASEVYTINNTNSGRGALIYNPDNANYVWSSGKSGTFNASQANSQWVIYPTGTEGQYYLYNVGAGKFAIPSGIANGNTCPWIFSDNAVAVLFEVQNDGTRKIKMATTPVSGTNAAYLAVSNGQTYPIINYNDAGGNFTITKVEGVDASAAANAAVAKLVKSQTALTAVPSVSGWYAVQILTSGTASHVGRYVKAADSEYNYNGTYYPLTFTGSVDVQPAINDVTFYTYIDVINKYWQMPSGKYLVANNNKFPVSAATATSLNAIGKDTKGIYFKGNSSYYAVPYNSGANYFIGESSTYQGFSLYPIDPESAGYTAWQVICDAAPETALISCSRSDVSGHAKVYKNGYFFLPVGVTPANTDFTLDGATSITVDASAKTITLGYDPNLAIVADGVSVSQGWQTAGRGGEVMLLKVNAAPFKDATDVTLAVNLKDGAESSLSALTLYEASSDSPEILSAGNTGAPTKTQVATTAISGSTATLNIGNLVAGKHYYWLAATVKSDAELGAVVDAAVTGITYTCDATGTTLDLTTVGDPSDRGAKVFDVRTYPFLPWDNGSHVYRIPALVTADDGSLIVACDKRYGSYTDIGKGHVIDIVVRRSTDGGKTWGDPVVVAKGDSSNDATCGYGDPTLTKLPDGTLLCTSCAGNLGFGSKLQRFIVSKSTDNGQTWSTPVDVTEVEGMLTNKPGVEDYFITSGKGIVTNDGILMYLLVAKYNGGNSNFVIYSTDQGAHWTIDNQVVYSGADEAKLQQLNDGRLIASVRTGGARGFNLGSYTKNDDGTVTFTWGTQSTNSQLTTGGANNQDIFYYSRSTDGESDILLHTMTTGSHANLKLYMSFDQGTNWTEVMQIQSKGSRYATMTKLNNGDLGILFEDQSLNATGGYTDYNHYPLNFITITKEQILALADPYVAAAEDADVERGLVKIAYGTTDPSSFGGWGTSGWHQGGTSLAPSGIVGLSLQSSYTSAFNRANNIYERYVLAVKVSATDATDVITITAPDGYVITGYEMKARSYNSDKDYTLKAGESTLTTNYSSWQTFKVANLNTRATTFSVTTSQEQANYLCIADFTVSLVKEGITESEVKVTNSDANSYGTVANNVWTSGESAGKSGLQLSADGLTLTTPDAWNCKVLGMKVDAGNGNKGTLTIQAPDGYLIASYAVEAQNWSSSNSFTITPMDGQGSAVSVTNYQSTTSMQVADIYSNIARMQIAATTQTNPLCFKKFIVTLVNTLKPATTITYAIVDDEGNVVTQVEDVASRVGYVPVLPTASIDKRPFCTYESEFFKDAACTTPFTTVHSSTSKVYSKFTFDGPFEYSTAENPKWYNLYGHEQNDEKNYYLYADGTSLSYAAQDAGSVPLMTDAYQWAFIGNPYQTKLLNKAANANLAASDVKAASNAAGSPNRTTGKVTTAISMDANAYPYSTFSVFGYTNSQVTTTNPFSLILNSSSYAWLDPYLGGVFYHSGIAFSNLNLNNWRTANVMATEAPATLDVTLNRVGTSSYATLYLPFDVKTDEGTKAYVIKEVAGGQAKMTELTGGEIAARTAVVLVNEGGESAATFSVAENLTQQVSESDNLLKGTLADMTLDLGETTPYYSMGRKQDDDGNYQIGFYKFESGSTTTITLGANKAYLDTTASSGDVKGFTLSFGGEDGIGEIAPEQGLESYSMDNQWSDLNGRRLHGIPTARGVYIVGGRKVVVK